MSDSLRQVEASARQQLFDGLGAVGLRMSLLDARMRAIIAASKSPKAKLLALRNEAFQLLLENDLASEGERIHCQYLGIHNINRYGDGIVPAKVHALLKGILGNSFQIAELIWPCCVEMPPHGNPRRELLKRFNMRQVTGSAGRLADYVGGG